MPSGIEGATCTFHGSILFAECVTCVYMSRYLGCLCAKMGGREGEIDKAEDVREERNVERAKKPIADLFRHSGLRKGKRRNLRVE